MYIPITLQINTDHIQITSLRHEVTELVNEWNIEAVIHVPDGHIYEGLAWPVRNDRMRWYIGPVVVPDATMQQLLGETYQGVVKAMSIGDFKPGPEIQQALIQALGTIA